MSANSICTIFTCLELEKDNNNLINKLYFFHEQNMVLLNMK